ncbi:MAG TPA: hypothetical protein VH796_00495 [Nitrososphaeraceae archaeon]|jgi:hypothetical protein
MKYKQETGHTKKTIDKLLGRIHLMVRDFNMKMKSCSNWRSKGKNMSVDS